MENANTRRETTLQKKQESNPLPTNSKEDTHTNIKVRSKTTGSSNHYSLISLNNNGLNSPIKRHRLMKYSSCKSLILSENVCNSPFNLVIVYVYHFIRIIFHDNLQF